ncbi:MAG: hypothetical protein AMXMBFR60_19420 [Chloroflexota bacterium]
MARCGHADDETQDDDFGASFFENQIRETDDEETGSQHDGEEEAVVVELDLEGKPSRPGGESPGEDGEESDEEEPVMRGEG